MKIQTNIPRLIALISGTIILALGLFVLSMIILTNYMGIETSMSADKHFSILSFIVKQLFPVCVIFFIPAFACYIIYHFLIKQDKATVKRTILSLIPILILIGVLSFCFFIIFMFAKLMSGL